MILVVNEARTNSLAIPNLFRHLGIPTRDTSAKGALRLIKPIYRALILNTADDISDLPAYTLQLRQACAGTPIFAICKNPDVRRGELFDGVLRTGTLVPIMRDEIIEYCRRKSLPLPGEYRLLGLDCSSDTDCATLFGAPLPFTRIERMILRTLIRSYPTPISPIDIISLIYSESRMPEFSNIRTHISVMNKKFLAITGTGLIYSRFGEGYSLLEPRTSEEIEALMV